MKRKKTVAAGVIVAGTALAFGIPTLAQADDNTSPAASSATTVADGAGLGDELRQEMRVELAERLAQELGLDADEVDAALEKVTEELRSEHQSERLGALEERLAAAVDADRLTQEQADAILEAAKNGDLRGGRMGHHGRMGGNGIGPWSDQAPDTDPGAADTTSSETNLSTL